MADFTSEKIKTIRQTAVEVTLLCEHADLEPSSCLAVLAMVLASMIKASGFSIEKSDAVADHFCQKVKKLMRAIDINKISR